MTGARSLRERDWIEIADASRASMSKASAGKVDVAKTGRKVATTKDQLSKKTVALGLHDSLLATTIDGGVIAKLEES